MVFTKKNSRKLKIMLKFNTDLFLDLIMMNKYSLVNSLQNLVISLMKTKMNGQQIKEPLHLII